MTNRRILWRFFSAIMVLAVALHDTARSEVAAEPNGGPRANLIFLGVIGDGSDPIGSVAWRLHRVPAVARALNTEGEIRGDGRPDFATLPTGAPLVVWAYNNGFENDIVVSEWTGATWSPISSIATEAANELDPRVAVNPDGSVHVVWWEDGVADDRVLLSSRSAESSTWSVPVQVNPLGESASRPSVVVEAGQIKVAYERQAAIPGTGQEIVVATQQGNGSFGFEIVATTTRTGPLDPILNLARGKLWVDWMEDDQSFGCSRWTGTQWEQSAVVPWSDGTWLGIEDMRRVVRGTVLSVQ